MISRNELLKGTPYESLSIGHRKNLEVLYYRMNKVRSAYGSPMIVTSGYRTMEHHLEIYARKGITDKSKIPMRSKHLSCNACDIYDPEGELQEWCKANQTLLEQLGLWIEDFKYTKNWVHFQIEPYRSYQLGGSIWFKPY